MSWTPEERRLVQLLAPLERLEPVRLDQPRAGRRVALIFALAAALFVVAAAALAAARGEFPGIGAAGRAPGAQDRLSPAVAEQLRGDELPAGSGVDQIGRRRLDSVRLLATLPSGRQLYVLTTSKKRLCVLVAGLSESCGEQLSEAFPITFVVVSGQSALGSRPLAYGVARDGVVSVSFTVDGAPVTLPVRDNVFAFEAASADPRPQFSAPTVTFADGSSRVVR